jgi:hypothetical protein
MIVFLRSKVSAPSLLIFKINIGELLSGPAIGMMQAGCSSADQSGGKQRGRLHDVRFVPGTVTNSRLFDHLGQGLSSGAFAVCSLANFLNSVAQFFTERRFQNPQQSIG